MQSPFLPMSGRVGLLAAWTILAAAFAAATNCPAAETAGVRIDVVDRDDKPLPCRIHLYDDAGGPQRAPGLPFWRDHFVCPGKVEMQLPPGRYTYEIERGPEYEQQAGAVEITQAKRAKIEVRLRRIAHLSAAGWYAGDLHVHRAIEEMPLLIRAEDLHVAPVITWWNDRNLWATRKPPENLLVQFDGNRFYRVMAGEDEREGGALMYFGRNRPLPITGSGREHPSPMKFVEQARAADDPCWIDVEKPFWWDVPVWLASGKIDSIGLANNHLCRSRMLANEAWGRPRDTQRLPPPLGNGFWTQEIYYHVLNCGLRIPPSAGSASGVLPNPLGYNRVYVHVDGEFGYRQWWDGLKAGRSFVTNGPLLICRANGRLPGHVFTADQGSEVRIELKGSLAGRDNVPALEIIKNGRVERAVPKSQFSAGDFGTVTFRRSGWFLVRAIADNEQTFRFASTAPYYVEIGPSKHRISRGSAQFFLDWVEQRAKRVPTKLGDLDELQQVLVYHERAGKYWKDVLARANAK